jgi:predicted transcriptional regulator
MNIKRHPTQVERDRREISRMYLSGITQAVIADRLGIDQSTVSRDLKILQQEWQVARINDIDERKRQELAKIDNLELEYWDAWRRSQNDKETVIARVKAGEKETTERREGQAGDPRFLDGVQWCINKRCELLGLNAPKGVDLTTNGKELSTQKVDDERFSRAIDGLTNALRKTIHNSGDGAPGQLDT